LCVFLWHGRNTTSEKNSRSHSERHGRRIATRRNRWWTKGLLISVSKVSVTTDLSIAKVYLSIFPEDRAKEMLEGIQSNQPLIKHELAKRTRNQLRRMPQLLFFIDDTLAYLDGIDRSLKGENNPIKDPDLLEKRKKA